jgi:hypothetical protein
MNAQAKYDIYNEFAHLVGKYRLRKEEGYVCKSVYIPTMHIKYTNAAIWHVFENMGCIVTRIDNVSVKTKDGISPNFKSAFVHFMTNDETDFANFNNLRIYPHADNIPYMKRHFWQPNPKIRKGEYWMLLPNALSVTNTTLTLDDIESKMRVLESQVKGDDVEALAANRGFLLEIRDKQNGIIPFAKDTRINVHQLARNIELMEKRVAESAEIPCPEA